MTIPESTLIDNNETFWLDFIVPESDLPLTLLYLDQGSGLEPHVSLDADIPLEFLT